MQIDALIAHLPADRVYKLLRAPEWAALQEDRLARGSADDQRDGYIHLSTAAQLAGTLQRWYADAAELCLLSLDPAAFGAALRWEASRGGERFPHLYAPLHRQDCEWVARRTAAGWEQAEGGAPVSTTTGCLAVGA
jgi:uncharacterized protein (DUF952 family)